MQGRCVAVKRLALIALCLGICAATAAGAAPSAGDFASIEQIAARPPGADARGSQIGLVGPALHSSVANAAELANNRSDRSIIDQFGNSDVTRVDQPGAGDVSTIDQSGHSQSALATQSGSGDLSLISQSAAFQYANVEQYGLGDYSSIVQSGQGNQAFVSQFGDGARSMIVQSGVNNFASVRQ